MCFALPAILLAACTGAAPADPPAVLAATPKPAELKTFKDWTVGCDNGGACKAASLAPADEEFPAVTMSIARAAGPAGAVVIAFQSSEMIPLPLRIGVDGKPVADGGRTDDDATRIEGPLATRILAAAANGGQLTVADAGRKATTRISLAGLSAALRYIDDRQGRAGTVTAAVATGAKPADSVRPAPALPVVTAVRPGGVVQRPSATMLSQMRKLAECETDTLAGQDAPELHALGGGTTLVMLPCSSGAYNVSAALFTLAGGKVSPVVTDAPSGFTEGGAPTVPAQIVNGGFDGGLVTSYAKGRGIGDCGVEQKFAWDGKRLRLVEQAEMGECRGNTDLITTWRATVRR
jgi:hypothetical protein